MNGGGRVGELDEEMVYEARAGQTFMLGASTWRIEEITRDRVLVSPAPGVPGAIPFWKGEGPGRPYELGEAIGKASRELAALPEAKAIARLTEDHSLDEQAAQNLMTFLTDQQAATGAVPSDRTVVVERFRDEIGDWRVCILTPFGARVHAPWAMAIGARLRDALGLEVQSLWSDDGIALHLPDADATPPTEELIIDPDEIEELVMGELGGSALFGSRFRENAGRALLIPRRRPGERTPLWQQRLKAQGLLQVARKYGSFPIILETYRECLQDVFDLPALKRLLTGLKTRQLDLVDVETATASPYSTSLLFDYVANYMYEDDTPPAERRAQALSLDRDLLKELLGQEELRELIDPGALEEVEAQLRGRPRNADELHDVLRLRGDLRPGQFDAALAQPLLDERRAITLRVAGEERLVAAEDAGRYRDALGAMPPGGLPEAFLEGGPDSLQSLVARFAKGRGPFTTAQANDHFGIDVEPVLRELEKEERIVRGELRPGGTQREWCDADVLRRLRRASLAALRKEVEPAEQATLGRFLPSWHGIDRRATLREALVPLQGLALPVSLWESEVLPRRVPNYQAGLARPALRERRARLGRRGARPRRRLLPRGRAGAGPTGRGRAAGRRSARPDSRGARARRRVLVRPARGHRARGRAGAPGPLGSRLGGRGDERRLDASARGPALRRGATRAPSEAVLTAPLDRHHRDPGPLVADRAPLPRASRPARARRAAARAAGDRHARRRARRGDPGRLQRGLRGAEGARRRSGSAGGATSSRARRRPVRARRSRRAAAGAEAQGGRGTGAARDRGCRSRPAVWRRAAVAEARGWTGSARCRRAGRPPRRRACALRRARRPLDRLAPRAGRGLAAARPRRARAST